MKQHFIYIIIALTFVACQNNSSNENNKNTSNTAHKEHKHNDKEGKKTAKVNYDCRHCGMPSQDFPKWKAKVVAETGEVWYCSPRCMFINTLNKEKAPKGIQSIKVISYYETKAIDAKKAMYVTESDVLGPMGHDLVPLKDAAAAKDFKNEHKGKAILPFDKVTMKIIQELVNKE